MGIGIKNTSLRAIAKQPLHMLIDEVYRRPVAQRLLRTSQ